MCSSFNSLRFNETIVIVNVANYSVQEFDQPRFRRVSDTYSETRQHRTTVDFYRFAFVRRHVNLQRFRYFVRHDFVGRKIKTIERHLLTSKRTEKVNFNFSSFTGGTSGSERLEKPNDNSLYILTRINRTLSSNAGARTNISNRFEPECKNLSLDFRFYKIGAVSTTSYSVGCVQLVNSQFTQE